VGFIGPTFFVGDMTANEVQVIDQIRSLAEPVLRSEGLELVEVQYRREAPGWVLRLFIDRDPDLGPVSQAGENAPPSVGSRVTIEDCVAASREIGRLLDVEDVVPTAYTLEVSSPGLDRPLTKPRDYERFSGRSVRVRYKGPEGRRKVKGRLLGLVDGMIRVETDGGPLSIPLDQAERVQLEPEVFFDRTT
jgi:ribosome maturation factor RimP